MAHKYKLNEITLKKIEIILPRLKHSLLPSKIIKWLENFNDDEVDSMLKVLSLYEYISYNEFLARLDDHFSELLSHIPINDEILVFPYGKMGKSGMFVTYPLAKTNAYLKIKNKNRIEISNDIQNLKKKQIKHIVFLDDFIGTGKTFTDTFSQNSILQNFIRNNNIQNLYLLSCVIMKKGKKHIKDTIPSIKIFGDERDKFFALNTPLQIYDYDARIKIKQIISEYCKSFNLEFEKKKVKYGYGESQSFISFFHSTPNNCLSIIWNENNGWIPLYPRYSKTKIEEARELKKQVFFFVDICNKLKIEINAALRDFRNFKFNSSGKIKNTKQDHSVVLLLFLKSYGYEDFIIAHILGLSKQELNVIYLEAKQCDVIDSEFTITSKGHQFLRRLKEISKSENMRKESDYNLSIKKELYLPITLNGTV
ncbi:phosphoribosyltransferase-like protein [Chryseobacterium arthrosphaerae]|uniref:phosphoribosyltransferase-like protein n=1 Tax=Chryseobacterium arthrosphaerae TaxID=651561 RepID=UPI00241CA9F5|nr:hypothetical protein [Chryseobacterium arthrosphaerae]